MSFAFIFISSLGLIFIFFYLVSLRHYKPGKVEKPSSTPDMSVSILVCARNEQDSIERTLKSLAALHTPADRLEVLVVSDNSTDNTNALVSEFIKTHGNFRLLLLDGEPETLTGKQAAIDYGMAHATGDIVFWTDADCEMGAEWVNTMLSYFDDKTGMVYGPIINRAEAGSTPAMIVDYETRIIQEMTCRTLDTGRYQSAMGANIAFRRDLYEKTGGMKAMGYHLLEDVSFGERISKIPGMTIRFCPEKSATIVSHNNLTWREFYAKRKRWFIGGFDSTVRPFINKSIFGAMAVLLCFIFLLFEPLLIVSFVVLAGVKIYLDAKYIETLHLVFRPEKTDALLKASALITAVQIGFAVPLLFDLFFSEKITWKGRVYRQG